MSRPSSAGGGGGGLGSGKAGGGKHGGSGGAAASAAAAGVGAVAGSGSALPVAAVALPSASLHGQSAELTALFECPVCFDYVLPPILQCQAGHLVCNQCRQKLSCCPTCRGPLTPSIRNLAMEKVASTLPFPCKDPSSTAPTPLTPTSSSAQPTSARQEGRSVNWLPHSGIQRTSTSSVNSPYRCRFLILTAKYVSVSWSVDQSGLRRIWAESGPESDQCATSVWVSVS
uniref:RING-type E3 ubiquitin transferase SIAH2 n=1 Tax=Oncorhynchus tshawytscha TaxID=74940 RepID=A0AAZ3PQF3_ONCTS